MKHFFCKTKSRQLITDSIMLAASLAMVKDEQIAYGVDGSSIPYKSIISGDVNPLSFGVIGFNLGYDMPHFNRGHVSKGCELTLCTEQDYREGHFFPRIVSPRTVLKEIAKFHCHYEEYISADYKILQELKNKYPHVKQENTVWAKINGEKNQVTIIKIEYSYHCNTPWIIKTDRGYVEFKNIIKPASETNLQIHPKGFSHPQPTARLG